MARLPAIAKTLRAARGRDGPEATRRDGLSMGPIGAISQTDDRCLREYGQPAFDDLHVWHGAQRERASPKSRLGQALIYIAKHWQGRERPLNPPLLHRQRN